MSALKPAKRETCPDLCWRHPLRSRLSASKPGPDPRIKPGAGPDLKPSHRLPQQGLALIAVLWIVAALGLVLGAIMLATRSEIRSVQMHQASVQAEALGQAGVALLARDLLARPERPEGITVHEYAFEGQVLQVVQQPANGRIDLTNAPAALLAELFRVHGGLSASQAQAAADQLVALRQRSAARGERLVVAEDLIRLLGLDAPTYARIAPWVTTASGGDGRVNVLAAPEGVLLVLARGDAGVARQYRLARDQAGPLADSTRLVGEWRTQQAGRVRDLAVRVAVGDRLYTHHQTLDLSEPTDEGAPWTILLRRTQPWTDPPG